MRTVQVGIVLLAVAAISVVVVQWVIDPTVTVGSPMAQGELVPLERIDHSPWDTLLRRYVDDDGFVDYASWHDSLEDADALMRYLDSLGRGDPQQETSAEGRLAFWINSYNALTVYGIMREFPTDSIRSHTAMVWGYNIWEDLLLMAGNETYSLNAMEHEILRKLGENRIHFAIVCASVGCPRLRNEAYTPQVLEAQLADNARDFFSRRGNFYFDAEENVAYVSAILDWFGGDFGSSSQEALRGLASYLPEEAGRQLAAANDFTVRFLDYDWRLNDQTNRPADGGS